MENQNKQQLKSYAKRVKEFDFSKEVVIDRLSATPDAVNFHFNRMKETFKQMPEEQIWQKVNAIIIRDNIFNAAMQIIVPCYEMHLDDEELNKLAEWLKNNNPSLKEANMNILKMIAQRMMEKQLVFEDVQKLWNIEVTTEEVINILKRMYQETNHSVRDVINDPQRIDALKPTLLEQKVADAIIAHLKYRLDEEAIRRNAEESARANAPAQETKPEEGQNKPAETTEKK